MTRHFDISAVLAGAVFSPRLWMAAFQLLTLASLQWTMSDMVKYRAAIWSFLKLKALYFTVSDIVHTLYARGVALA